MSDPVADYGARILTKGVRFSGDVRTGLKAAVPYLLEWPNAFAFCNAIILPNTATHVGLITLNLPYRLPPAVCATPVYAQTFDVEPCGVRADLTVTTDLPNRGLAPGEFFSHAIVRVGFEQLQWAFDGSEDPDGLNQLDPENPITFCEQSVKIGAKMVTRKGALYRYVSTGKAVVGDVGIMVPEAKLVLKFPRVPYLPWQLLVPYVGKVNSAAMLGCEAQTLLLEAPDTQAKQALNAPTPIEQAVTLEFAYDPVGWNKLPLPDGTPDDVIRSGGGGIYDTADFREIFDALSFVESA